MNNKSCIYFAVFVLLAFLISKLNVHFEFGDKRITEKQFDEITNRLTKCEAHAKSWHVRKVPTAGERAFAEALVYIKGEGGEK